jgi:hypothetical protein
MSNIKIAEIWEKTAEIWEKTKEIWENNAEIWQLQDLLAEIWQLIDCGNLATYCGNMNASRPQRSREDIPYHFKIGRPCPF